MSVRPLFIGSEIYRQDVFPRQHPLAIARVSAVMDLAGSLGWLPADAYLEAAPASDEALARFHDPALIAALRRAEAQQRADEEMRRRHHIGCNGNPVHPLVFTRPATACGATLRAAGILSRPGVVHSPAGGTHHGRRDRAAGFCYLNDVVLGLLAFLDQGLERVAYVDLDAHHPDGVQDALSHDARLLLVSVHEAGRWPRTGTADDRGGGSAVNLPVPPGFHDDELAFLMDEAVLPLVEGFRPEALVLQCGADGLADDPQSRLALSNRALWRAVGALGGMAPRLLVLGGGGYNPWSVARCWTGVWGTLNGYDIPEELPFAAQTVLRSLAWSRREGRDPPERWFATLADPQAGGPVRDEVRALAQGRRRAA
jgi:acetoin utilization protein AcuC